MGNKYTNHFELQLIVIGILIPIYLITLPLLIQPILFANLRMEMPKIISYILGVFWFICLLFGTYSLMEKGNFFQKESLKMYKALFTINNLLTIFLLGSIATAYFTIVLSYLLTPLYKTHYFICVSFTILVFILLIILIVFLINKNKKEGGNKDVRKK